MPRASTNRKNGKPRYKSITVDIDVVEALQHRANEFVELFGFRPTISQTLRHVLMKDKT